MSSRILTDSALLEHAGFVRALAAALLRDPDRADDVAQDTLVRALEQPPRDPGSLRRWLARVAQRLAWRTRRGDSRRARRERAVARPEAEPVDRGRETVLATVTAAVLALREPFRSTVLARYYEGRSAGEIAAAAGVSVHTVHSRLRRAHELLRARLDREMPGGRTGWTAGLCALTSAPAPLATSTIQPVPAVRFRTFFAVSTNTKLVAAGGLLLLLAMFRLLVADVPPATIDVGPTTTAGPAALAADRGADTDTGLSRTPVVDALATGVAAQPDGGSTTGSVILVVTWAADGSPAAGRTFSVYAFDDPSPLRTLRTVCTDEAGVARVDGLTPGAINLYGDVGGDEVVHVAAGEEVTAAISIPIGIDMRGVVVDDLGRRVGGATVWLTEYGNDDHGHCVAGTDDRGAFRLPNVGAGRSIGAFAAGHAPSRLVRVEGEPGSSVGMTLVLGPLGAELSGQIVDAAGIGVAGAELQVEFRAAAHRLEDRRLAPRAAATDAAGGFAFAGLATGTATLLVRPRGQFAPRSVEVELSPGESRMVTVELSPLGKVAGVVRDVAGLPVTGAEIRHGDYAGFLSTLLRTDADGRFTLDSLPLGDVDVRVEKKGVGKAQATLRVASGLELEWNPTLLPGRVYKARIVDEEREPRAGWSVYAVARQLEGSGLELWSRSATSGADGRFELTSCPDGELQLEIRAPHYTPVAIAQHRAQPGGPEDTIVITAADLPSANVTGSVLDADGRPAAGKIAARQEGRAYAYETFVDKETGRFELTEMIRGDYTITFAADGHPTELVGRVTLAASAREDLGVLQLERPGHLRVTVRGGDGVREPVQQLWITEHREDRGDDRDHAGPRAQGALPQQVACGTVDPVPLRPGRYDVHVTGRDILGEVHRVEIRAGETATLALDPRPGERCTFVLEVADGTAAPSIASLVVRNTEDHIVASWASVRPGRAEWTTSSCTPTGTLRLTVRDGTPGAPRGAGGVARRCGELEFTVPAGGGRWHVELR